MKSVGRATDSSAFTLALSTVAITVVLLFTGVSSVAAVDLKPGDILVTDIGSRAIIRVDPATGNQTVVSSGGSLTFPTGIAVEASGQIVVVDGVKGVLRVDPASGVQTVLSSGGPFVFPFGIAIEANGKILVADEDAFGGPGGIIRVDPVTGEPARPPVSSGQFFAAPSGIAIEANGSIIVADQVSAVPPFNRDGGIIRVNPVTGVQAPVSAGGSFGCPFAVAVEASGDILATTSPGCKSSGVVRVNPATGEQIFFFRGGFFVNPAGLAVEANGNILVADTNAHAVIRVHPVTGAQSRVSTGGSFVNPHGIAIVPTGPPPHTIRVGHQPDGVAVNSVTNRIYIANEEASSVSMIDGASNSVATINVGRKPRFVAVDPVANRVYVTRYFCRCVSVIDGATNLLIAEVPVAGNPNGIDVNPVTRRVYVATINDSTQGGTFDGLVVIDGTSNTILNAMMVGTNPVGVAVNPNSNSVYVTNAGSNTISVVDGSTDHVLGTISVGSVSGISVNPETGRVYAPNPRANTVAVIDGMSVTENIGVGNTPISVAIDRSTNRIYVANATDRTVSIIDGSTNLVVSTVLAGGTFGIIAAAGGLGINTTTHRVYVSHQQEDFISFFDTDIVVLPPPQPPAPPAAPQGTISGRVLDPNGTGVGTSFWQLCPSTGKARTCSFGTSDASGIYQSPILLPGVYYITAFPPLTRPDLGEGILLGIQFVGGSLPDQNVRLPALTSGTAAISGRVFDDSDNPVFGALVDACLGATGDFSCWRSLPTDTLGQYRIPGLVPGIYDLKANPPANSLLLTPAQLLRVQVIPRADLTNQDLHLGKPKPPLPSPVITVTTPPANDPYPHLRGGNASPTISATGCPGANIFFEIDQKPPKNLILAQGLMTEVQPGKYTAAVVWAWNSNPFSWIVGSSSEPRFGFEAVIHFEITCPNLTTDKVTFQIYVDPSGTVKTPAGTPIVGATVTLDRSETGSVGSFDAVPDGDVVMSPSNRQNPDTTEAGGRFGWDVLSGFYVVRAEKDGCYSPSDPSQPFVETPVLKIPPAALDLDLFLTGPGCPDDTMPPTTRAAVTPAPNATGWSNADVTVILTAVDNDGGSGVEQITYSGGGAQAIAPKTVKGDSASVVITAEGLTSLTFFATDRAANIETKNTLTVKLDKTAPTVTCVRVQRHKQEDDEHAGGLLFQVIASDNLSQPTIMLGGFQLTSGEIIQIKSTKWPGVRLVGKSDDDDQDDPKIRRFRVGPGSNVIKAVDDAGNVGTAVCPVPPEREDDDDDRRDAKDKRANSDGTDKRQE